MHLTADWKLLCTMCVVIYLCFSNYVCCYCLYYLICTNNINWNSFEILVYSNCCICWRRQPNHIDVLVGKQCRLKIFQFKIVIYWITLTLMRTQTGSIETPFLGEIIFKLYIIFKYYTYSFNCIKKSCALLIPGETPFPKSWIHHCSLTLK